MKIYNPATEEVIREITSDNKSTIDKKFKELKSAQPDWSLRSLKERINIIEKFSTLLQENKEQLAHDLHLETGKKISEAISEIEGSCTRIQFFIDNTEHTLQEKIINVDKDVREVLSFEPLGVIVNISAWNYPYFVGVNVFIPALLSGNAVLYKPSEYATLSGLNIEKLLKQAGVPADVFRAVIGDGTVGQILLDINADGYFFTGSYQTGKFISQAVSHKLVPIGLELGGKDPVYVMDGIDNVENIAAELVEGCFYNNGQSCCAVERIYVHEKIYDNFVAAFVKETRKLKDYPPLTRPQQLTLLEKQIHDALEKGANIEIGGKRISKKGAYLEPTVLTNVNHDMSIMKEESFGPVIGIQKVSNDEEALKLMQDTEYGLTAGIYGKDENRAKTLLKQIEVGTGYFNCCDRVSPHLPWSGRMHSGLGSTLSYLGILAFVKPKAYMLRNQTV